LHSRARPLQGRRRIARSIPRAIEQWFAKLKALLRKAAARTFDALIHAIASAPETFTQDEWANYLANSGCRQ
jgi:transposase